MSTKQQFKEFLDDSAIKVNGGYIEQTTQYRKLYTLRELYKYFINQILN